VGIHPEGTRNPAPDPADLLPAKGGAGRIVLAAHPDVLVLPYFLTGLTDQLPREIARNFLPAGRRGPPVRLVFGEPVRVGDLDRAGTPREVSQRVLERVRALHPA
jgi:1-acyl-sn-glycerol-3-phosphate acyltransferase